MKHAVVTCLTSMRDVDLYPITQRFMREYARRLGAGFKMSVGEDGKPHWENRFRAIREALDKYERVTYLDPWCIVRFDCPDLFGIVPEAKVGMFDEADLKPAEAMEHSVAELWNQSVIVCSRRHKNLFKVIEGVNDSTDWDTFNLDRRFNRTPRSSLMSGETMVDSFIINLEGVREIHSVARRFSSRFSDFEKNGVPKMYQRINIDAPPPLGDCVATEPVVRYIAQVVAPNAKITVRTAFPEVFEHLRRSRGDELFRTIPEDEEFGFGRRVELLRKMEGLSFNMMHPIDYASLSAFGGTLPDAHRAIELYATSLMMPLRNKILIHPGQTWKSRTFPVWFWQAVIDLLIDSGFEVAVIGKNLPGEYRGIVKGLDTSNCLDLVDKLSLSELISAIACSAMLISNDSSPIHISGAFEKPTIMINSCKQKDFIWPKRRSGLNITLGGHLKAAVPSIGLVKSTRLDECSDEELLGLLPSPESVVSEVVRFFRGG